MSEETGKTEDGDAPLAVRADDFGDRFLIYKTDRGSEVELRLTQDTFWASQRQMADSLRDDVAEYNDSPGKHL